MRDETIHDTSTQALMMRYVDGDQRAFDLLARAIEPKLRGFFRRRTGDLDLVDDLVQQTFLRVHTSRDLYAQARVNGARSVEAWFMTTAVRTLLDYRRYEHRRIARVGQLSSFRDPSAYGAPPPTKTPEQQLSAAQEQRRLRLEVHAAVDELPRGARDLIRRHKLEGHTIQGMAGDLGIAAGTLRVRAHRAYRKLAQSLRPLSPQTA